MGVRGFALLSRCFIQNDVFRQERYLTSIVYTLIMVERVGHMA